jgi:hypothetical protein
MRPQQSVQTHLASTKPSLPVNHTQSNPALVQLQIESMMTSQTHRRIAIDQHHLHTAKTCPIPEKIVAQV